MKFGDFYCERCAETIDEKIVLDNPEYKCPECGYGFFVRQLNLNIQGANNWRLSPSENRKAKGDKQRLERGMGGYNI